MIEEKTIFDEVKNNISLVCDDDCDGADLAAAVGLAVTNKMRTICVAPKRVADVWPWVEGKPIKIVSRFVVDGVITEDFMFNLAGNISESFRDGANGAIVLLAKRDLRKFAAEISSVREDLFFNKTFGIGIDIDEIGVFDWDEVFGILQLVRVDSLVLTLNNDTGNKSDFVGRVFAMLNANRGKWTGGVSFMLGQNFVRIDQVYRLIQQMQPETISKTEFFIDNE